MVIYFGVYHFLVIEIKLIAYKARTEFKATITNKARARTLTARTATTITTILPHFIRFNQILKFISIRAVLIFKKNFILIIVTRKANRIKF